MTKMYRIYVTCMLLLFKSLHVHSCRVRFIMPNDYYDYRKCNNTDYSLGMGIEEPEIFHNVYNPYFLAEHMILFPAPKDDYCEADYQADAYQAHAYQADAYQADAFNANDTVTDVIIYDVNEYNLTIYDNDDYGKYYVSLLF